MKSYFELTRTLTYSLLFAAPLLLLYELGTLVLARMDPAALRNGADVLLRSLLAAGGIQGTAAFTGLLLAIAVILIVIERRRRRVPLRLAPFAGMAAESVLYALLFGSIVGTMTSWLLGGGGTRLAASEGPLSNLSVPEGVVLSLGAGVYEEIVFRVLLVGGLFALFRSSGISRRTAAMFAALLAALVFSGFHYIGPYGDQWAAGSFVFRFLAGLAFSVLFLVRGFGITAWTHALYDVFIFAARGI
ncbi:MAG TPA: CPBP family glutamic-type intramembrane protease [Longimicrobiaceae bacterium]|nr:CPBP family glutamic-type intramembrane protease [Longimicrobium sp.]